MSDSQQQEEVSRIAKKLQEAKIQDAKLQEEKETTQQSGSESSGASSPIKRKKIADAIASDASIDENLSVAETRYIAHEMSQNLVDNVFADIIAKSSKV